MTVAIIEPVLMAPDPPTPERTPPPPPKRVMPSPPEPVREVRQPDPLPPPPIPEKVVVVPPPQPAPEPVPVQVERTPPAPEPERIVVAPPVAQPVPPTAEVHPEPVAKPPPPEPVVEARWDAAYLDNPKPGYPPIARRMGLQGRVLVRVFVSTAGLPEKVELRETSGSNVLDRSALDAVTRWRFIPARQGEKPISAWILVPIVFTLKG